MKEYQLIQGMRTLWFPHVLECYLCFCHKEAFVTPLIIITLTCMKDIFAKTDAFLFVASVALCIVSAYIIQYVKLCESINGFLSAQRTPLSRVRLIIVSCTDPLATVCR